MRKHLALLVCIHLFVMVNSQSTIDSVLASVLKNSKWLQANKGYWEARNIQYRTGNAPEDPTLEYDRLTGSPSSAGTQVEFTVSQSFDFPTVYAKRKKVADQQTAQSEFQLKSKRQDLLLETKRICIQLVFRNKSLKELKDYRTKTEEQLSHFIKKLNAGEGNIMDVNKAKLQLLEINRQYEENQYAINTLQHQLTEMNGGIAITFSDTVYPLLPVMSSFEQLESEYEAADPVRKVFEQEVRVIQGQLELSRSLWLPKMEAGYHYQGILGQKFSGFHAGISIPLWEQKNTVKLKKQEKLFAELQLQDHLNEHYYEIKQLYEKYISLQSTLKQYQEALGAFSSSELLKKSLSLGQISSIEYFMEMSFYRNVYLNYLQTEMQLHSVIAELLKYKL